MIVGLLMFLVFGLCLWCCCVDLVLEVFVYVVLRCFKGG